MKGHTVMYVILGLFAVLLLSRAAAAAGLMTAGGSAVTQESEVLTGQFAQSGGNAGTFTLPGAGSKQSTFSLS